MNPEPTTLYRYRYTLSRRWTRKVGDKPPMVFVMLNPSTADETNDDPTIRRCIGFAKRDGHCGIEVVNLFALRCTRPVHLFDKSIADDPEGPENLEVVRRILDWARVVDAPVVAAWGAHKSAWESKAYGLVARQPNVQCLGMTADGSPRHPLYVKGDKALEVWP